MKLPLWFRRHWFRWLVLAGVVGGAAGVWMLLHPAAFWLAPWRPEPSTVAARFIFGPYPVEADFQALQRQGVTTIVSLLDADLPYEKILLAQETRLAEKYGMRVLNFPMASILGQSFGKDYVANSQAAAEAALASPGIVYIHCYLGLHRAFNVRKILQASAATDVYQATVPVERSPDRLALDRASAAYRERRHDDALRELASIQDRTAQVRLLEGWTLYRLNRIDEAYQRFDNIDKAQVEYYDAILGLGYCALRTRDLVAAERRFKRVLSQRPDDLSALEGLGHVRYRQGRPAEARELFGKVLEKNPDHAEVRDLVSRLDAPRP